MNNIEDTTPIEILASRVWGGTQWHHPHIEKMVAELRRLRALESDCRAAGFIGEGGEVRKVLGFYALNEDGTIFASEDDPMLYREPIGGDVERAIASVELRGIDREYRWFLTREAALAAKEAK